MAFGSSAGRRRGSGRSVAGAARSVPGRQRLARSGVLRNGSRPANTLWLPITAAAGVLLLLLWYAMAQSPSGESGAVAPVASALAEAGGPDGAPGAVALPTVPPPPASGCDTGQSLPAGVTNQIISVAGTDRQYQLAVPQGGGAGSPLPLIVSLHDQDQSPAELEQYTQLTDAGTRAGYAVAAPLGAAARWNFTRSAEVGPDDVLFVGTLLNDLTGRMCLDAKRVFLTGFSDGADMAFALACALPDRIAALVTAGSSRLPDDCAGPRASVLELHGTEDPIAPWDGGGPARPAPYAGLVAQPVESRLDSYARALGCGGEHPTSRDLANVMRTAWTSCPNGKDVGVLAMQGGGHTWPGAPVAAPAELGRTVSSLSATVVALAFFAGHPADGRTITGGGAAGGGSSGGGPAGTPEAATPRPASATPTPGVGPSASTAPDTTGEPATTSSPTPTPVPTSSSVAPSASTAPEGQ